MNRFFRTAALLFLGFFVGAGGTSHAQALPDVAQLGGSWAPPAYVGQGFSFDFDANTRVLYWFTSTPTGDPAFFVGVLGEAETAVTGQTVFRTALNVPVGATFTTPQSHGEPRGQLELEPLSCTAALVRFAFDASTPWCTGPGASGATCSGEWRIERLTRLSSCSAPAVREERICLGNGSVCRDGNRIASSAANGPAVYTAVLSYLGAERSVTVTSSTCSAPIALPADPVEHTCTFEPGRVSVELAGTWFEVTVAGGGVETVAGDPPAYRRVWTYSAQGTVRPRTDPTP